jgi:hypothetical protein
MSVTDVPETNALDEDSLGYTFPTTPSDLRTMPDEELARLWRRNAFANRHPLSSIVEQEMNTRLIAALKSFKAAADRSSRTLNVLTFVLVVLTVVLVIYTIRAG